MKPEKGTPLGQSFPIYTIIRSAPPWRLDLHMARMTSWKKQPDSHMGAPSVLS